jgi:cellulose synthase/poly-beta-1,6-N-acetylglucosamine synthase-like glycosyltransferase
LYKKEILDKLGNFSEDTITEDAELATRLLYNRYKVLSQMEAVVYVRAAKTMRAFYMQRVRWDRGLLLIMAKYRGIVFNREYGALGYIFPLYMSMFGLLVTIDILLFVNIARLIVNAYNWIANDIIYFVYPFDYLKGHILGMDMYFLVPSLAIFLCGVYMLIRAHKYLKEKLRYPLATIIFLTAYQVVSAMFWLVAVIYEATGTKKAWRGKTRW